ncbi:NUDIX domain-containing protein [Microbacterium sp. ZW T5_56]|uniref:NUDIX hydrolase n=1 Tax=Microbacterium sp. ZW T5_56 TaxID=3378081 RepID=UPI0038548E43
MSADEWWDVVDRDGVPTGETHRRDAEGWPAGGLHLVVATCVLRAGGCVLVTQRASGKEFEHTWEFPGGSALAGETSRVAASRELHEETGLFVPPDDLTFVNRFAEESALVDFYLAEARSPVALHLQASEVVSAEWVAPDEVERRLNARLMAPPWTARLAALWPGATATMRAAR